MNIGIDIDGTHNKYPKFFVELGRLFIRAGHEVYIITGLGHDTAVEQLGKSIEKANRGPNCYTKLIDTSQYNEFECSLIKHSNDVGFSNELIVGIFKQRICKELGIDIMFDDKAKVHRYCGNACPIIEI